MFRAGGLLAGLLVFLSLGACDGTTTKVGAPCASANLCGAGRFPACIRAWPDGYCTDIECGVGSCPEGSSCVTGLTFPDVEFDKFCLADCTSNAECRTGYRCVEGSPGKKICAPESP